MFDTLIVIDEKKKIGCESNMKPITICHNKNIMTKIVSLLACDFTKPLLEFDMFFLFICEVQFNFCDWIKLFDCLDQSQLKANSIPGRIGLFIAAILVFSFFFKKMHIY